MDPAACEELTSKLHGSLPESTETDSSAALALLDRSYSAGSSRDVHGVKQEVEMRRRGSSSSWGAVARLSRKVKEQRARFYIMRRCVHMLVCWRDDTHC